MKPCRFHDANPKIDVLEFLSNIQNKKELSSLRGEVVFKDGEPMMLSSGFERIVYR
jgi:hypothetical protein